MATGVSARASSLVNPALVAGVLACCPAVAHGATLYVDQRIPVTSCTTYSPAGRSCSGGASRAYRTLYDAANAAVAGDTVSLRAGTYSGQLSPARSGTPSAPITFAAYPAETPTLAGNSNPVLWLVGRSHIVVDGLTVSNVGGWGRLEDAAYNTIRNCTFVAATIPGTAGGLKLVRSTYNRVLDNTFDDGNDNITVQESDRNVIQGNTLSKGRHSLLSIRCGSYNVVRRNTFSNRDQKGIEIYDCTGVSDAPVKLDATRRNLIEENVIADTPASTEFDRYNGIQLAGQMGIVRRNVFRDDGGGGLNFQYYADEALYNNRNRSYHNTFYNNGCYGIVGESGDSSRFYDNRARNNLLYLNTSCSGAAVQTRIANSSQVILSDNAITATTPGFVDEAHRDLRLGLGSPMIDAGAFLTTTTATGSGTALPVADASYFHGGYGIPGELGDEIQLEGESGPARVLAVDLAANVLALDRSLSWTAGAGVALRYFGTRPDLGAYESEGGAALPLTVSRAGPGSGTVASFPPGIGCGTDCAFAFETGAVVTLEVVAAAGSSFAGWSGACTGTGPCRVTMTAPRAVTASFALLAATHTLTVETGGAGAGTVTSSPPGISCGAECAQAYSPGTLVTLSPTPEPGSTFAGWGGGCTGTGSCRITLAASTTVSATFSIPSPGGFYTVVPCRALDTRDAAGPHGGPALGPGATRVLSMFGVCGIPASARALSLNLTVTQPTAPGSLRLFPDDVPLPVVSSLNYAAGATRANNAVAGLSEAGAMAIRCTQASGSAHVIVDVNGYFE